MSKLYSQMSTRERWNWHAEIYAFRRVVLGVPMHERRSPCDEKGEWFDEQLIERAEWRLRDKQRAEAQKHEPEHERMEAEIFRPAAECRDKVGYIV